MADFDTGVDPNLTDFVQQQEGYRSHAYRDGSQWSIGYGTRATSPNETLNREDAAGRLQDELWHAQRQVDGLGANMSPQQRNALTSFTYNTGNGWMQGPMGDAVRNGDWQTAAQHMLDYTHSQGKYLPGLANRRAAEAGMLTGQQYAAPGQTQGTDGAPTQSPSRPQMAPANNYEDYIRQLSGNQDTGPFAGVPVLGHLFDNSRGMSPLERAGIYMMSVNNPSALSALGNANKMAEQRNQMALEMLRMRDNDAYRNAMLQNTALTQQRLMGADARTEQALRDKEEGPDMYGRPQDSRYGPPQGPNPLGAPGGMTPMPGQTAPTPAAPAAGASNPFLGTSGLTPFTPPPAASPGPQAGPPGPQSALTPGAAYGMADNPTGAPTDGWGAGGEQLAQNAPRPRAPNEADFTQLGSQFRKAIADSGVNMDMPGPQRDAAIKWALGNIQDAGIRGTVQNWINGGLNPDLRQAGATGSGGVYPRPTQLSYQIAAGIVGEKNIENAWKTTDAHNKAYAETQKPNGNASLVARERLADNMMGQMFLGDPNSTPKGENPAEYSVSGLYDKLQNNQYGNTLVSRGFHIPVPFSGGMSIPVPGMNSHYGQTGDTSGTFGNAVREYQSLKTRYDLGAPGVGEERGIDMGRTTQPQGQAPTARPFDAQMQPNEFKTAMNHEMDVNIRDMENYRDSQVNAVGGINDPRGKDIYDRMTAKITQARSLLDNWNSTHPWQQNESTGRTATDILASPQVSNYLYGKGGGWSQPRPSTPLAVLQRIQQGGQ